MSEIKLLLEDPKSNLTQNGAPGRIRIPVFSSKQGGANPGKYPI
jgi:hypothetical protein